ncbi:MAG TPA: fructosamine kinase family protein [Longimicrobiales bacterium]
MTLPDAVREAAEHRLGVRIAGAAPVGGGCISAAWRVQLEDGSRLFLKTAPANAPDGMLLEEALSLRRLADTGTVRVPAVRAAAAHWLALEWLEPSRGSREAWAGLGRALARLHRHGAPQYGWESTNCIGPLPQANDWLTDWPSFWRERRLEPLLRRGAARLGRETVSRAGRMLERLEERLGGAAGDGPSLLHGDLWNGNVHFTGGGAALIDPSSYYGHREVDLAMAALFGGFAPEFFSAYAAEWPLLPGSELRRPLYQLYYLLVHVNLFGGGYIAQTKAVLDALLR